MSITRTSYQNIQAADSWDMWPMDDGSGFMLVMFRNGFSSVISTFDGPFVWKTEKKALDFLTGLRPNLPRYPCDPGPRVL